jgi:hypothetical protein
MKTVINFIPDGHNPSAANEKLPGKNCVRATRRKNNNA